MNINELLKGYDCACGRHHSCDIKSVFIEKNACERLTELCADCGHILLAADENTYAACGEKTESAIGSKIENRVIFDGAPLLIPDETAIAAICGAVTDKTDLIVGIGSGVIQDLCKYCANKKNLHYIIVATAPSMDGYASTGAAMITGGMKVTYKARVPFAILADTDVIAAAPFEMIQAGYGDIIGKLSALNDWKLSNLINGEYFCEDLYDKTMAVTQQVLSLGSRIKNREPEAIRALMEALILVGIFMSFAGSSRPASGSEHHLSHFYEITGILFYRPYFPHGIDVAYSAVITAKLRQKLLQTDFDRRYFRLSTEAYRAKLAEIYGPIAKDCENLQAEAYTIDRHYGEKQAEIKAVLSLCPGAEEIRKMLGLVGLDMREYENLYGEALISTAVSYAKELKDRYTVLWVGYDLLGENAI